MPLTVDEIAIYKIKVYRDNEMIDVFYNTEMVDDQLVFTSPLCIEYANYDQMDNDFAFELWIYAYNEATDDVEYIHFYTWEFSNFEMIESNNGMLDFDDGVVDFVLGDCVLDTPDLQLPIVN